jgi:cyanophycinase
VLHVKQVILSCLLIFIFSGSINESIQAVAPKKLNTLFLVGGGRITKEIKYKFIELAGGRNAKIILITQASKDSPIKKLSFWKDTNAKWIKPFDGKNFYDATGIWITGGNQTKLAALFRRTAVERQLKKLFSSGIIVGGTSAGASIVSEIMPDKETECRGFGLLDKIIIDQHFTQRHRLKRLVRLIRKYPKCIGIGIDESTAIIMQENRISVLGQSHVSVCKTKFVKTYHAGEFFGLDK